MKTDDELVARALDGLLSAEEEAAFAERLKRDPALAQSLLELARTEALLGEVASTSPGVSAAAPRRPHWGGLLGMAAVMFIATSVIWVAFSHKPAAPPIEDTTEPAQSPDKLKEAWPHLLAAWAGFEGSEAEMDEPYLKAMARLHEACGIGDLYEARLDHPSAALKQLFVMRRMEVGLTYRHYGVAYLSEPVRKLADLKRQGLDDEDNVQDAMGAIRGRLKDLRLMAEGTPPWARRRFTALACALLLGQPYPEPARPTADEEGRARKLVESLKAGDASAGPELLRLVDGAEPVARELVASGDAKLVAVGERMLGIAHEPWKAAGTAGAYRKGVLGAQSGAPAPETLDVPADPPAAPRAGKGR